MPTPMDAEPRVAPFPPDLRAPGVDLDTAFTHIRSRTHLTTEGQQTPWHLAAISEPIEKITSADWTRTFLLKRSASLPQIGVLAVMARRVATTTQV